MMLTHITSNTGQVARTTRGDVADAVVALLRPLVAAGSGPVPQTPNWYVDIWQQMQDGSIVAGGAAFQIAGGPANTPAGKLPYLMAVACWRTDRSLRAWLSARIIAAAAPPSRLPATPPPVPWLTVTILPGMRHCPPGQIGMLGDFERCLGWTLIEAESDHWLTTI